MLFHLFYDKLYSVCVCVYNITTLMLSRGFPHQTLSSIKSHSSQLKQQGSYGSLKTLEGRGLWKKTAIEKSAKWEQVLSYVYIFFLYQVTVAHINATAKNAADDKLRQSLRRFAETHTAPATVILVSCEFSSDSL